jgi:hypothetical protein
MMRRRTSWVNPGACMSVFAGDIGGWFGAPPAAGPSAGRHLAAIVVNAALLFVLNGQPGRQALLFVTGATTQVLGLANLSLAAGARAGR